MKTSRSCLGMITLLFLWVATGCLQAINIVTTVETSHNGTNLQTNPSSIHVCYDTVQVKLALSNISGPGGGFQIELPNECTAINTIGSGGVTVISNLGNHISCGVTSTATSFEFTMVVPCNATPVHSQEGFQIAYLEPPPGCIEPPKPLPLRFPSMAALPHSNEQRLVGPNQTREFDIIMSQGIVDGFTLVYRPENELHVTGLTFTRKTNGAILAPTPLQPQKISGALNYIFTPLELSSKGGAFLDGEIIHVVENFDVVGCSQGCSNSQGDMATFYDLIWYCHGNAADLGCNHSGSYSSSILVDASAYLQ